MELIIIKKGLYIYNNFDYITIIYYQSCNNILQYIN